MGLLELITTVITEYIMVIYILEALLFAGIFMISIVGLILLGANPRKHFDRSIGGRK
jgi:hypothetical protein